MGKVCREVLCRQEAGARQSFEVHRLYILGFTRVSADGVKVKGSGGCGATQRHPASIGKSEIWEAPRLSHPEVAL